MRHGEIVMVLAVQVALAACATDEGGGDPGAGEDAAPAPGEDDAGVSPAPDAASAAPDATTQGPQGPVMDPAVTGPYEAGVMTLELTDPSRSRTLPVDVWYPVHPGAVGGEPNSYRLDTAFGTLAEIDSPARRDAPPATGAFPLILFSHGFGGIRFQSYFLTEHLATHGFVVVSPDHPGNTIADFQQLGDDAATAQSAMDRPLDVLYVLDRALTGLPGLAVTVDPTRIATTGHSFGAWTALEVARRDPRIAATFPMAPGFRGGSTADFVATLARPLFIFGGSLDDTTPFPENQQLPYDLALEPKYLVSVTGAGHLDFSNLCEVPIATLFVDDGCDPANIDPALVHERVRTLATAFVHRQLMGDDRYEPYLAVPFVTGLGHLEYWRAP